MNRNVILAILVGVMFAAPAYAQGGGTADAWVGKTVRGRAGVVLGQVTRIIPSASGAAAQVLVTPRNNPAAGPRSVSVRGLVEAADGLQTPLTKAEFEAMPTVELEPVATGGNRGSQPDRA